MTHVSAVYARDCLSESSYLVAFSKCVDISVLGFETVVSYTLRARNSFLLY